MMRKLIQSVRDNSPGAILALVTLCVHFFMTLFGGYGYFRDEFYYLACSDQLAWGYVDHPPLSIFLLWLNRTLLGDSLFALRLLPAAASAGLVYLTGLVVRELQGRKLAQFLACSAVVFAPVYLAVGSFYSMNAFEPLFWIGSAYVVIKILNTGNQKLWLLFGALAGLGLQNKHSMLFFGFALAVGLLLTSQRRQLVSKWFWIGAAVAVILFIPNLLWQAAHDWATLEFMQNAQQWKNAPMSPVEFLSAQVLFQQPIAVPLWCAGVLAFLFDVNLKKFRLFGLAYLVLLLLFIVQRGKPYYLSPVYPLVLSAGAILFERFSSKINRRWIGPAYAVLLVLAGMLILPLAAPALPAEAYVEYTRLLGLQAPKMERHADTKLPQVLADRLGWKEMVAEVAKAYHSLTPEEQSKAAIYTQNYGQAGAIDFFGGAYQLPKAICGHNNYWLWGVRGHTGEVLIIVGGRKEYHREVYRSVELASIHKNAFAMPFETDLPIFICKDPMIPLSTVWERVKRYI